MKYIVEFEDEPYMYEDGAKYYKCIQAPWWGLSEKVIKQLTPYQPDHVADVSKKVSISCGRENDLISRQEALKKLAVYIHLIDKTMGKGTLTDDDCMEAAKSVLGEDELPAVQPEQHWIPVSERLPEERGFYLTTTKDKAVYCDHWNEDNFDRTEMVIAWMPLPEPYRGGGKE